MNRWVVYRLGAMGDVALTTGVLRHWGEVLGGRFTVVTRRANAPLFAGHPFVEEVVGLEPAQLSGAAWARTCATLARAHRGKGLADLHGTPRSAVLRRLWRLGGGGPVRGYRKMSLERRLYLRFGLAWARARLLEHNVPQRYALALEPQAPPRAKLAPHIRLNEAERAAARERLAPLFLEAPQADRPLLAALHPFATHAAKSWPDAHWRELAAGLRGSGASCFFVGRGEGGDHGGAGVLDFVNATELRETCALLAEADLLVTADSGPMHLAAAVGTPVLALFGPTDPAWGFYPEGPRDRVLTAEADCRPCSLHGKKACDEEVSCMERIRPEDVLTALWAYAP